MSGPMFAERAGRCALPQRKARILPRKRPKTSGATYGAIHPEDVYKRQAGMPDAQAKAYLETVRDANVALFGTLGAWPD